MTALALAPDLTLSAAPTGKRGIGEMFTNQSRGATIAVINDMIEVIVRQTHKDISLI